MANGVNIPITADNRDALRGISQTRSALTGLQNTFSRLQTVIGGLAIGAFVKSALQTASAVQGLGQATGIATTTILGLQQAFVAAGGTSDRARDAISDLTKNLGEAANGSTELQRAFQVAGVSVRDLQTLSEEDILRRTIEGLNAIPDSATRTATAFKLFGESVKGLDLSQLNSDLERYRAASGGDAAAIEAAARANANFAAAFETVQMQLLSTLEPLSRLATKLLEGGENISRFIESAKAIGTVVAVVLSVVGVFRVFTTVISGVLGAVRGIQVGVASLGRTFEWAAGNVRSFIKGKSDLGQLAERLVQRFKFLQIGIEAVGKGLAVLGGLAAGALAFVFPESARNALSSAADTLGELVGLTEQHTEELYDYVDVQKEINVEILRGQEAQRALNAAIAEQTRNLEAAQQGYRDAIGNQLEQIRNQQALIGLSDQERQGIEARNQALQATDQEIRRLQAEIDKLQIKQQSGVELTQQETAALATLTTQLATTRGERLQNASAVDAEIQALQRRQEIERANKNIQTEQLRVQDQLRRIQDDINKSTLTERERKYYDISAAARDSALSQIRAEEAIRGRPLDTAEVQDYYRRAQEGADQLIAKTQELQAVNRDFATGWRQALNEYRESATDAATSARDIFTRATRGMEDAIVGFAKTGKLNFKSLLSDIAEMILRSQIQRLMANLFDVPMPGGGGGGGGGNNNPLGFIGDLFAGFFATGGRIPRGQFGVVGEAGPELVSGPATVTPMSGGTQQVIYNIQAVDAMSFKQLVASDPGFIHAVAMAGGRGLALGR